jgi:hypothetical protein
MNAWKYMINLNSACHFGSRERRGEVSNSELGRWLNNKVVKFDGVALTPTCEVVFPLSTLTLFTKKKKITIL